MYENRNVFARNRHKHDEWNMPGILIPQASGSAKRCSHTSAVNMRFGALFTSEISRVSRQNEDCNKSDKSDFCHFLALYWYFSHKMKSENESLIVKQSKNAENPKSKIWIFFLMFWLWSPITQNRILGDMTHLPPAGHICDTLLIGDTVSASLLYSISR